MWILHPVHFSIFVVERPGRSDPSLGEPGPLVRRTGLEQVTNRVLPALLLETGKPPCRAEVLSNVKAIID